MTRIVNDIPTSLADTPAAVGRRRLNILMLGGAKRVSVGRMFVDAGRRLGCDVSLYSYELSPYVPVAEIARIIIGKRWSDADILDDIKNAVAQHSIDIILPFVDGAIEIASEVASTGDNVYAPVSSPSLCRAMFDKSVADTLFREASIPVPPTHPEATFPLIAKPLTGSASKGIEIIQTPEELERFDKAHPHRNRHYLLQKYIYPNEEYTIDCFIDRTGDVKACVPRRRLEVTGGEVTRTITVDDSQLMSLARDVLAKIPLRGAVTLQFLKDCSDGAYSLMEINPRLGGGVVCSIHAGADIPTMILSEARSLPVAESDYIAGVEIARYMQEVIFDTSQSTNRHKPQ